MGIAPVDTNAAMARTIKLVDAVRAGTPVRYAAAVDEQARDALMNDIGWDFSVDDTNT